MGAAHELSGPATHPADERPPPTPGAADERLAAGVGALVRLFCARFMPEVEPPGPRREQPPH